MRERIIILVCIVTIGITNYSCIGGDERLEGGKWQKVYSPTEKNIYGVCGGNEASACGEDGIVMFRMGHCWKWRIDTVKFNVTLYDISMLGTYAVGENGFIIYDAYQGQQRRMECDVDVNLYAIRAYGDLVVGDSGVILDYNENTERWERIDLPFECKWRLFDITEDNEIWILGERGVLHLSDDSVWMIDTLFDRKMKYGGIWNIYNSPEVWVVVSDGKDSWFYYYDGREWKMVQKVFGEVLKDLALTPKRNCIWGFAVGSAIYEYEGYGWKKIMDDVHLNAISTYGWDCSPVVFYAVGDNGEMYAYRLE